MAGKVVWASAIALSIAVAVLFAYALPPAETTSWLSVMAHSFMPKPSSLAIVLPLVFLWILAAKAYGWLDRRLTFKGSGLIKAPIFLVIVFSLPVVINVDVIAETLWKVKFSAAFGA